MNRCAVQERARMKKFDHVAVLLGVGLILAVLAAVTIGLFIKNTLKGHHYRPPVDPTLEGVEEEHNVHHHERKEEEHD